MTNLPIYTSLLGAFIDFLHQFARSFALIGSLLMKKFDHMFLIFKKKYSH